MLIVAWLFGAAHAATPFFGVEWRPLSRQDLVWVDESRTSGTAVGEFDGAVRPVLSAFGGVWVNRHIGLVLGLGLARASQITIVEDVRTQQHQGVFRPSLDLRFGWMEQAVRRPVPWFLLGVYGDVPSARNVSDGYDEEAQEAADEAATVERARLGGVGGRAGFGVDYRVLPGLLIGAQVSVGIHRSTYLGGEIARAGSLWVATEAGLLLTFEWPGRKERSKDGAATEAASVDASSPPVAPAPDEAAPAGG